MYDEFGNYFGPELESDEESEDSMEDLTPTHDHNDSPPSSVPEPMDSTEEQNVDVDHSSEKESNSQLRFFMEAPVQACSNRPLTSTAIPHEITLMSHSDNAINGMFISFFLFINRFI